MTDTRNPCSFCGSTNLTPQMEDKRINDGFDAYYILCISCYHIGVAADTLSEAWELWNNELPVNIGMDR